jgi:hypothetical protein
VSDRLRHLIPVVIGLVLFVAALEVLRVELRHVTWHDLTADLRALSAVPTSCTCATKLCCSVTIGRHS